MKHKIVVVFFMISACLFITACANLEAVNNNDSKENIELQETSKIEISMEEAVSIGMVEANKHYDNLRLTEVHSYDNDGNPSIEAGQDGKRQWWYVNFGNEKLNYVNILIENGEIVDVQAYDENGNNGLFDLGNIKLTSKEAVEKAIELGLLGGNPMNEEKEWVSGYNFALGFGSLTETPDDKKIFFEVIGVSKNRNFSRICFDATTGDLLLAVEKYEYENGEVEWKLFNSSETLLANAYY